MNDNSERVVSRDDAFIEHHYYKGGLRTDAITTSGGRPEWAPAEEWVGFRNELSLEPGDFVVEVVKFKDPQRPITWFGVFQAFPDQVFGDRQNHTGIGVWLRGGYPKEPWYLLDALKILLGTAIKSGDQELPTQARQFLTEYLEKCVDAYDPLPRPLGGLSLAKNQVTTTLTRRLDTSDTDIENIFDDLVYRLFFYLPENEADKTRALIFLTDKAHSPEFPTVSTKPGNLLYDLLRQLPLSLKDQSDTIKQLESDLQKKELEVSQIDLQVDRLAAEASDANRRANVSETQLRDLQASLEENDEHKRFSTLQSGIGELGNQIAALQGKVLSLRREIVDELAREMRSINNTKSHGAPIRQKISPPQPVKRASTKHNSDGSIWHLYFIIAMILLAFSLFSGFVWYFLIR